jgi:hypothetical protein
MFAVVAASLACLRPRGRHVQVGLLGGAATGSPMSLLAGGGLLTHDHQIG